MKGADTLLLRRYAVDHQTQQLLECSNMEVQSTPRNVRPPKADPGTFGGLDLCCTLDFYGKLEHFTTS
eukprot:6483732-Amphidinium_carterae.1